MTLIGMVIGGAIALLILRAVIDPHARRDLERIRSERDYQLMRRNKPKTP